MVIPIVIIPRQSAADLLLQGILRPIILTSLTDIPIATVLVVIPVPTFLVPTAPGLRQRDIVGMPPQNPPRLLRPRLTKKTCTRHIVRTWAQKCPVIQAIDSVMGIQVIVFTRMPLLLRLLLVRIHLLNRHGAMTQVRLTHNESKSKSKCTNRNPTCTIFQPMPILLRLLLTHTFLLLPRHRLIPQEKLTIGPPGTPFILQVNAILLHLLLVKAILLPRHAAPKPHGKNFLDAGAKVGPLFYN